MTVDEIYLAMAKNISSVIKEDWQSAVLNLEVLDGMVSNTGTYINTSHEEKQIDVDEFDFQLTFDILELRSITTEGENNKWNKAIFRLESDGKFNMEFIWDQQLHDQVEKLS
ncbi:immunity protein YezG family protein [Chitinophaga sp. ARDCPP14]|uniref:immunity protein YezG family protein n=1 Tax=Chitinophaga sp. ARDCPP14 TaxID=3391139 RepID=UPI003F52241B